MRRPKIGMIRDWGILGIQTKWWGIKKVETFCHNS
jgi:hypothetical protein